MIKKITSIYCFCGFLRLSFLLLGASSMQKRKYLKGFYFNGIAKRANQSQKSNELKADTLLANQYQASTDNSIQLPITSRNTFNKVSIAEKCDTIILNNGVKMLVKVVSEGEVNIIYKTCEGGSDELKTIDRSKVKRVGYGNGDIKNPNDDKYIDPYQNTTKPSKSYNDYNNAEAERGDRQLDNALIWFATCVIFSPGLIVGFILAALARKKLKDKPGYERRYRLANTLSVIGAVLLGIMLFFIALYLFIMLGI